MANYNTLKTAIQAVINENHNNEITGTDLQNALVSMISSLGVGYQFMGIATPTTNPGTPDQNVFYIATQNGTYTNFDGLVVSNEAAIFAYNGQWEKLTTGFISDSKFSELENVIYDVEQNELVGTTTDSKAIQSNGTIINAGVAAYKIVEYSVTGGNTYLISGSANYGNLIWCWYDDDNNVIERGDRAGTASTSTFVSVVSKEVIAPIGATKLIIGYHTQAVTAKVIEETKNYRFQPRLQSGINIKTINGNTILGSGNVEIKDAELEEKVNGLESEINSFYDGGGQITIDGTTTDSKAIQSNGTLITAGVAAYKIVEYSVTGGNTYLISGSANYGNLIWCWYDDDNNVIERGDRAGTASTSTFVSVVSKEVIAPIGATKLIIGYHTQAVTANLIMKQKIISFLRKSDFNYVNKSIELIGEETLNKAIGANGTLITAGAASYRIRDYVVSDGMICKITANANYGNRLYAFYDADNNVIQLGDVSASGSTFTKITNKQITTPTGATKLTVAYNTNQPTANVIVDVYARALKWYGKKWVCVGDSLTDANNATATKRYFDYVAIDTDIQPINMGLSGSGYARKQDTNQAFYQRILNIDITADVVTIFGSFNDLGAGLQIGSVDDSDTTTLAGCINKTIDNLYSVMPLANLGIVAPTPWDTTQPTTSGQAYNYCNMLKAICERRSIPYLDLWHCSGLRPWDANFRTLAYSNDGGSGTHPDNTGHKILAPRFEAFLDTLLMH